MESDKNNLWSFGCSFAAGTQCNPGERYYDEYPLMRGKKFTTLLSEKYDLELNDLSIPGTCNEIILYKIIETIPYMSEGDIVIIGQTLPTRTFLFNPEHNWFGKDHNRPTDSKYIPISGNNIGGKLKTKRYSDKFINSYMEVHHTSRINMERALNIYYNDFFKNVKKIIEGKKCKCFIWDNTLWGKFHTVKESTNGLIDDGHYSWQGHHELYDYLRKRIDLSLNQ